MSAPDHRQFPLHLRSLVSVTLVGAVLAAVICLGSGLVPGQATLAGEKPKQVLAPELAWSDSDERKHPVKCLTEACTIRQSRASQRSQD